LERGHERRRTRRRDARSRDKWSDSTITSTRAPSASGAIGPRAGNLAAEQHRAAAIAPQRRGLAVLSLVSPVRISAPITRTRSHGPPRSAPQASDPPLKQPVQPAPTPIAPARSATRARATTGAALGISQSWLRVAASTKSASIGSMPASWSAARRAQWRYQRVARQAPPDDANESHCASRSSRDRRQYARRSARWARPRQLVAESHHRGGAPWRRGVAHVELGCLVLRARLIPIQA